MMKASTRLDSSHKQRRRRGSPEMNKGERRWVESRVGCRELEGGGDKAGQGGSCESLVSGLIVLSLKLTVCCSKRTDATADLSGAIEAGNKEDFEKYSKRTVKTQSFSLNSLVLLLSSHADSGVSLCGKLPLLQNSSDLRIVL
ncbi:hypothetical protein DY000_02047535 [Brassica cretica]|uniref:Uncharacterized protein n=1 Tax=Brassica cretica TaxID=69181 RepID=A0ABQ7F631_BRACR|nr:hypothetical protein DY000_02047535 [Brassica cretica]